MSDRGIKIIRHLPSRIDVADDPSLPLLVTVTMRPPEFMLVTFIMLYGGSEEIVARCADRAAVDRLIDGYDLRDHPRTCQITVKSPDGSVEEIR